MTLSTFVGAILVGIAGARWVTNEADKLLLRAVASEAAKNQPSEDMAATLALTRPAEALKIFQNPAEAVKTFPKTAKALGIFQKTAEALKNFRNRKARPGRSLPKRADELATVLN